MKRILVIIFLFTISGVIHAQSFVQQNSTTDSRLTANQWIEDLNQLVQLLEKVHPNPYARISRKRFDEIRRGIEKDIPRIGEREIIVRMMKLVSLIRDGHTTLHPVDKNGFNNWFPISFYKFSDGIYVVGSDEQYRDLIGLKVRSIGTKNAGEAFELAAALLGSDNEFGRSWNAFFLSSGDSLAEIGVSKRADRVSLELINGNGKLITRNIVASQTPYTLDHRFWGEMYAPEIRKSNRNYFGAVGNFSLTQWRRKNLKEMEHLPLHLRSRSAYWYKHIPERKTMYVFFGYVTSNGGGGSKSFKEFYDQVFEVAEKEKVEKFILDIRYNSGGDGSILIPFVHKFIQSSRFDKPGRLFTLVGRKTFSAGVMLYDLMLKHTNTILVGEPAGAPRNHFGNAGDFALKNSGIKVNISTVLWQLTSSEDLDRFQKIDVPAVFSGKDYFSGVDPAVDHILALPDRYKSVSEILTDAGGEAAERAYSDRKQRFGKYRWWKAFSESSMRFASRNLAKAGKIDDGKIGFKILLEQYPESWRGWRDYGIFLEKAGDKTGALKCFKNGLDINAGYDFFRERISKLEKDSR